MERDEISAYYSGDDGDLKAIVFMLDKNKYEVDFYKGGAIVATESYENRSLLYHEEAAENYVLGIKTI